MLIINTQKSYIQDIIDMEPHLNEVVKIDINNENALIEVGDNEINLSLNWSNDTPPYLLPNKCIFNTDNFLAIVYLHLYNFEKAYIFSDDNAELRHEIDILNRLQHGIELDFKTIIYSDDYTFENYRIAHNQAILAHYGNVNKYLTLNDIINFYKKAISLAPDNNYLAFTLKHYLTFLIDNEDYLTAKNTLTTVSMSNFNDSAKNELLNLQLSLRIKELHFPYNEAELLVLENDIKTVIQYFQSKNDEIQVGLLLIEACVLSTYKQEYAEGLSRINKAIENLEEIPEFVATAQYRKGLLMYSWAQNNNPQFFKPAMLAFQEAIKVFNTDNSPEIFAEIQHMLGVIYSEIPDEIKVKSMWAAVSVSSFNNALQYFTQEAYPYEFAKICNSFGNAYTKYPAAVKFDNYQKALELYRKALEIRTADEMPTERALTIINFLEAAWFAAQESDEQGLNLYQEMKALNDELPRLTNDATLISEYDKHKVELEKIAAIV